MGVAKNQEKGHQETTKNPKYFSTSPVFLHLLANLTCFLLQLCQVLAFAQAFQHKNDLRV